jgi:hypothetical protein
MLKLKSWAHHLIIFGLAILLIAVSQLSAGHVAWADGTYYQTVPTRTPTPDPNEDSSGSSQEDDSSDSSTGSKILGEVKDLSSGKPAAGVTVRLNDIEVKTDSRGRYSLSGLSAGKFVVSLVLNGEAVPAQDPVEVTVDGKTNVTVNLAYYSVPPQTQATPLPATGTSDTETGEVVNITGTGETADATAPNLSGQSTANVATTGETTSTTNSPSSDQPAAKVSTTGETTSTTNDNSPELLPQAGGVRYSVWVMFGIGLISLLFGLKLNHASKS